MWFPSGDPTVHWPKAYGGMLKQKPCKQKAERDNTRRVLSDTNAQ